MLHAVLLVCLPLSLLACRVHTAYRKFAYAPNVEDLLVCRSSVEAYSYSRVLRGSLFVCPAHAVLLVCPPYKLTRVSSAQKICPSAYRKYVYV